MGAGIGFTRDAQSSSRQNRDLRKRGDHYESMKNNKFINAPKLNFKEATPEELAILKADFIRKKRHDKLKQVIIFLIVFTTIGLLGWQLMF